MRSIGVANVCFRVALRHYPRLQLLPCPIGILGCSARISRLLRDGLYRLTVFTGALDTKRTPKAGLVCDLTTVALVTFTFCDSPV